MIKNNIFMSNEVKNRLKIPTNKEIENFITDYDFQENDEYLTFLKKLNNMNDKMNFNLDKNEFKLNLKLVNNSPNPNPKYAKEGDSGFDMSAWLEEPVVLKSLERKLIPTGIHIELPYGYEAQIRPRSGCALNMGLGVLNSPSTIDQFYSGECKIIAVNLSNEDIIINNGDRIAQMVICPVANSMMVDIEIVNEIKQNDKRGNTGFGSSGMK